MTTAVRATPGLGERRRSVVAGSVGNAVEFVDWNIYATFAPVFASQFFPNADKTAALLSALAVFAVGFIMRPIGGAVLGPYVDKFGRKRGLTLTVGIMAGASLVIALCPGYATIGIAAPIILCLARLAQGFSNGGEFGASSAYLVETAPPGRRAFYGSWQQVTVAGAHIIVAGLGSALTFLIPDAQMESWGWRIPFAFGAVLGLVGLWLRVAAKDSGEFRDKEKAAQRRRSRPLFDVLKYHPRAALRVVGITIAGTLFYYVWISYMPAYVNVATGMPLSEALLIKTISITCFTVALPFVGILSDRVGRKVTMSVFAGGFLVFSWPAFALLRNDFWTILGIELVGMLFLLGYSANCAAIMSEQFPAAVRGTGIALPYALAVALFGGTAPYITTWLQANELAAWTPLYLGVAAAIGLVVYLTMPETKDKPLD
ncbi:MAG: MFS transporter [Streptosporangiales bacterium]|nr:MFS transporter [Streptosporangiales bacterium]